MNERHDDEAALLVGITAEVGRIAEAEARRDELIRRAYDFGVPRVKIARASGLSRSRIHQIAAGQREDVQST